MQFVEQTLDSREVAEMVEKKHNELLKDIRRYSDQLSLGKILQSDFFTESSYKTGRGKEYPCYLVTKKGCEFIAHKLTGQKGTEFTARYINRFHEMEEQLRKENHMDWYVNDIGVFQHREFGILRTIKLDGQDYFIGLDATRSLGYVNSRDTLKKRVSDDQKCYVRICDGKMDRNMVAITRKGMDELIQTGQLPLANKYGEWIRKQVYPALTGEVIPVTQSVQKMPEAIEQKKQVQTKIKPAKTRDYVPEMYDPLGILLILVNVAREKGIKVKQILPHDAALYSMLYGDRIGIQQNITVEQAAYELAWELAHAFIHYDGGDMIRSPLSKEYNDQASRAAGMIIKMLNTATAKM